MYARISSDSEGLGLGVQRQTAECTAEANRRGWQIVRNYVDNDVSATRSKVRPEYQRMLADAEAGAITGLIVWDVDRLTRTPRELEDIIDLADKRGLALASVGGDIDLATEQGRMMARMKGTVARYETEQQSRRLKSKFQERAEAGQPHSYTAYGYRRITEYDETGNRVGVHDELHPEQAAVIQLAARLLLGGQSLRGVTGQLNRQGFTSPRGMPWTSSTLKQIMVRDRNAGLRRHRGQVIGKGQWPPMYDQDTHDRVVALLTDPSRRTYRGSERKHLLTGIARCGRCEGPMIVNVGGNQARMGLRPSAYVCKSCTRVVRSQIPVEQFVESVMIARLQLPDALAALSQGDPLEVERSRAKIAGLEARLELAADEYADGGITGPQLRRITDKLRPQIDKARAVLNASMPTAVLADMAGPDAERHWQAASLETKRAVIEMLCTIKILPSGPGKPFDPALIDIEWKA